MRDQTIVHLYTHGGIFHADDIFATAFLQLVYEDRPDVDLRIYRVISVPPSIKNDETNIIYDIGGGKYDHHTPETIEYRNNDALHPYASFGKIVRDFYPHLMTEEEFKIFDMILVDPIDAHDCGVAKRHKNALSLAIGSFNPNWYETRGINQEDLYEMQYDAFMDAVDFARAIIRRYISKAKTDVIAVHEVNECLAQAEEGQQYLVFDAYVNYGPSLCDTEINWAIYPSAREGWQIFVVNDRYGVAKGSMSDEIYNAMKEDDQLIFVHPGRFTAGFQTKERCIYWAKKLTENEVSEDTP